MTLNLEQEYFPAVQESPLIFRGNRLICLFTALAILAVYSITRADEDRQSGSILDDIPKPVVTYPKDTPTPDADSEPVTKLPNERRFEEGPLLAKDFQMPVPDPQPVREGIKMLANTHTKIRYTYRYQTKPTRLSRTVATATSIEIFSLMLRDQSWNAAPDNAFLMEHEQGHFDEAQIGAAAARMDVLKQAFVDNSFKVVGQTPEQALDLLKAKIEQAMKPHYDAMSAAQKKYDEYTTHGTNKARQIEYRKKQIERLNTAVREANAFMIKHKLMKEE